MNAPCLLVTRWAGWLSFRILWLALVFVGLPAMGQSFDVATIEPSDPDKQGLSFGKAPGGGFRASNTSLKLLIEWAYDIRDDRLYEPPKWLETAKFDITARGTNPNATISDLRLMLRSLLADRFKLSTHRETKTLPMYVLVLDKNGVKVQTLAPVDGPGQNSLAMSGAGHLKGTTVSSETLAKALSNEIGRSVVDQTDLKGVFNFDLAWTPDDNIPAPDIAQSSDDPSLFTALREQLGLRLQPQKGPAEVLVIDPIEKLPTPN